MGPLARGGSNDILRGRNGVDLLLTRSGPKGAKNKSSLAAEALLEGEAEVCERPWRWSWAAIW